MELLDEIARTKPLLNNDTHFFIKYIALLFLKLYVFVKPFPEMHTLLFRIRVDIQKAIRLRGRILVHRHKLLLFHHVPEMVVDLFELFLITHFVHNEMRSIQPHHTRQTHPRLYQKTNSERNVSVFDSQMIHHIRSAHTVQVCTLTIIHNE